MSQAPDDDAAPVRFPPPLVPVIALAVGAGLHWLRPLPLPEAAAFRYGLGTVLVALGIGVLGAAFGLFRRTGQDPAPWESTPEVISTGIYRYTRNPMYVSMGLLQTGIGVLLANGWVVALVPVSLWAIWHIAIRHEEGYLERKFGTAYTDYKRSVRRWL